MAALQTINLGNYANDGTGDDLRTAFEKVNTNFTVLLAEATNSNVINVGAGVGLFGQKNSSTLNLEFKGLTSTDGTIAISQTATTVNLHANTKLLNDTVPKLGATLDLNGFNITGSGDLQATAYGYDLKLLNNTLQLILESGAVSVDLGTFTNPTGGQTDAAGSGGYVLDMGTWTFGDPKPNNQLNFGTFV
jgi:hypothetical protein